MNVATAIAQVVKAGMLLIGFGQSQEGEVSIFHATESGITKKKFPFPFEFRDGGKWYNLDLLTNFWTRVWEEVGGTLEDLIKTVRIFGVTFWGADLVLLDENYKPLAAANYPSALRDKKLAKRIRDIDRRWWHFNLKGAAQDAYQPLGVLGFMFEHLSSDVWSRVRYIVPVSDYLRYTLTGEMGHDINMLQSMGLRGKDAQAAVAAKFEELFGVSLPGELCPWPVLENDAITEWEGVYVAPFSHDSIWARLLEMLTAWMGSWGGVAVQNDGALEPNEATLEAEVSFEGYGKHQCVQANIGLHGATFEQLAILAELGFPEAAEAAREQGPIALTIENPDDLNSRTPQEAAGFVQGLLNAKGLDDSRETALAVVLQSLAKSLKEYFGRLTKAVGKPFGRFAITGGPSENRELIRLLRELGMEVVIPDKARDAAELVYIADMVRRWMLLAHGVDASLEDIVPLLPAMVRK